MERIKELILHHFLLLRWNCFTYTSWYRKGFMFLSIRLLLSTLLSCPWTLTHRTANYWYWSLLMLEFWHTTWLQHWGSLLYPLAIFHFLKRWFSPGSSEKASSRTHMQKQVKVSFSVGIERPIEYYMYSSALNSMAEFHNTCLCRVSWISFFFYLHFGAWEYFFDNFSQQIGHIILGLKVCLLVRPFLSLVWSLSYKAASKYHRTFSEFGMVCLYMMALGRGYSVQQ